MDPNIPAQVIQPEGSVSQSITEISPKSNKIKIILLILLGLIALIIVGMSGYYLGVKSKDDQTIPVATVKNLGESENKCEMNDGYVWCEKKDKCLRLWEEPCVASQSASLTNNKNPDWQIYVNNKYGYSINYPKNWYSLSNAGIENDSYFSTKNVSAPLEMTKDDIWLTVSFVNFFDGYGREYNFYNSLFNAEPGDSIVPDATKVKNIIISGQKAVQYTSETLSQAETEYGYSVNYAIRVNTQIYQISFLSFSKNIADKNLQLYDQIVGTFSFTK
jgi:hypothetical protein